MIIITGGAGFIGSCILSRFNRESISDIIIVDELDSQKEKNLKNKKFQDYLHKDKFLELIKQKHLRKDIELIIHMGACSSTTLEDKDYFEKNNYLYSVELAKFALSNNIRFLYASSAATYGDGRFGYSDSDENTARLQPLNLYGWSKQKFDLWVLDNKVIDRVVGFKFFNVFGPNEYHKSNMRSVVAKQFEQIKNENRALLFKSYRKEYKDGEQKRDFIYVEDAVDVVFFFINNSQKAGIYNVGTGKARSWNDLMKAIFLYLDRDPVIEYIDMPVELRERYQYFTQADISKLRNSGYQKEFMPLEDAVSLYCSYLEKKEYL